MRTIRSLQFILATLLAIGVRLTGLLRAVAPTHRGRAVLRRGQASLAVAFVSALLGLNGQVAAAPTSYIVTPSAITTTGGCTAASGCAWKAYQNCSLANQTVGALVGTPVNGVALPGFAGDTTTPPTFCIRAEGPGGAGAIAIVNTLTVVPPPGATTYNITCTLNPVTGGPCVAVPAP